MRTLTINGDHAELFVPMMKFDERTGEFEGWASFEEKDGHREICDIEKSWPAIVADAQENLELSGGKKTGVIRRQHDRTKAIGKETFVERRDRDGMPGIFIKGLCTDKQAKSDAASGVLTGLSIRGLIERWPDENEKGLMRYAWKSREETSMVDRPAVPHALIEVMKSNGGVEMVKALGYEPPQGFQCRAAGFHAKKEEARKCEEAHDAESEKSLPTRIEASKSLWTASDLIALISSLLCITDSVEYEEMWEAINDGNTDGLPIAAQLKDIARRVFDVLTVILNDERAELVEDMSGEAAMSYAMQALGKSEKAKALVTSLRASLPRASNPEWTPEQITEVLDSLKSLNNSSRSLSGVRGIAAQKTEDKMLDEAQKSHISTTVTEALKAFVAPLAKALKLTMATPDVADVAKALEDRDTANAEAMKAHGDKITAIEAQSDAIGAQLQEMSKALAQTLAVTNGVKVADSSNLTEVLKAIENKPAPTRGQLRAVPVSKADDDEAAKAAGGDKPVDPATLPVSDPRARVAINI